ncbi:MAG TPA: hypothetical protein VFY65_15700 [Longimicrobium sp.]|nr:hypothetical protein [Longimicrobium sp.]
MSAAKCPGGEPPPPPRTPTQYVVAVDLSSSLTPTERANHEKLLRALVKELDFGDRLVLMKAHAAGIRDTSTVRTVSMPTLTGAQPLTREQNELDLQRDVADRYVTSLFKTAPVNGTDLFATMHTAGERAREGTGARKVLVVLSDMLQCTSDVCMERSNGLPDSTWLAGQKQQGLVPALDSVCVSVVGPDATTTQGVKVREFWSQYFQTAGASFSANRYVHNASTPSALRCET